MFASVEKKAPFPVLIPRPVDARVPRLVPNPSQKPALQPNAKKRQRAQALESEAQAEPSSPSKPRLSKKASGETTVSAAVDAYIQDQIGGNRSPKTIEWHRNALGFFVTFLTEQEQIILVIDIEAVHITAWFAHLRTTKGAHGKVRSERTVQTYARSLRAFCHWLIRRRFILSNPFDEVIFPKVGRPPIKILTEEELEKLLWACAPPNEKSPLAERAAVRNRAILWVLYDTGIRVSELCGLSLDNVDRKQGVLTVWGKARKSAALRWDKTVNGTCFTIWTIIGHLRVFSLKSLFLLKRLVKESSKSGSGFLSLKGKPLERIVSLLVPIMSNATREKKRNFQRPWHHLFC